MTKIQDALQLLDQAAWRATDPIPATDLMETTEKFKSAMYAARDRRNVRVAQLKSDLSELDLPTSAKKEVDAMFDRISAKFAQFDIEINTLADGGFEHPSELWFWCVDMRDNCVLGNFNHVSPILKEMH